MKIVSHRHGSRPISSSGLAGGIHPPGHKPHSLRSVIMETPIPDTLIIPFQQHQGSPATPVVRLGESVLKGQILAEAANHSSLPVHAPTSGRVTKIVPHSYPDEFGSQRTAIELQPDGQDRWLSLQPIEDWQALPPADIINRMRLAGICGLGGAGFPAHRKFHAEEPANLLIINAVECEPYITADQALLREYAREVISGARILQHASQAAQCVIATESDKMDAIESLREALPESGLELVELSPRYPLGSEKQLVELLTGQQIPTGKHPADLGVLVFNVGTAKAVSDAVHLGRPLISRVTTVCGDTLRTPKNFQVLIGTPVSFLLTLCGVDVDRLDRLVLGGSMMGHTLAAPDVPVIKTTNCLIAGSRQEFPARPAARPCIRCDFCSSACPVNLMPQFLYLSLRAEQHDKAGQLGLGDCIECGACAYVCPSNIPLVQYYRAGKFELTLQQQEQQRSAYRRQRFENRKHRLARDAAQRRGSRRRSIARPENPDVSDTNLQSFSRQQAKLEIADAVARVKARKQKSSNAGQPTRGEKGN
ncbi:MAG: electron transport complex subunit RsxC [Gammaproteobacteria bacterium]|nr:electron transport complex subunit RsxC [Gammaproteobacteria bacterium]